LSIKKPITIKSLNIYELTAIKYAIKYDIFLDDIVKLPLTGNRLNNLQKLKKTIF
jgi:hypothetical protein